MILFIDTHTELITIALKNKDDLYIKTQESEYSHSIYTMPMIESIFKENNLSVNDLDKIIAVNGPGSFTGIRIGLSIAKTMAYALKIDINTISSLEAYLISSDISGKKKAVIEDPKGYYIGIMENGNIEEYYSTTDDEECKEVSHELDINKIIDYCSNKESENPHFVKANYVKKIEVLNNDK